VLGDPMTADDWTTELILILTFRQDVAYCKRHNLGWAAFFAACPSSLPKEKQ
jgi:hypothetical protein